MISTDPSSSSSPVSGSGAGGVTVSHSFSWQHKTRLRLRWCSVQCQSQVYTRGAPPHHQWVLSTQSSNTETSELPEATNFLLVLGFIFIFVWHCCDVLELAVELREEWFQCKKCIAGVTNFDTETFQNSGSRYDQHNHGSSQNSYDHLDVHA